MPESSPSEPLHPLAEEIEGLSLDELHTLGDSSVRHLLSLFTPLTSAHEIAVWAKDPNAEKLVPIIDTAGSDGNFEMRVSQDLSHGIVSRVYTERTSYLDKGLWRSKERSKNVDNLLHQITQNEMCVPFYLAGQLLGVMSAVQLTDQKHAAPSNWGFKPEHLEVLVLAAEAIGLAMERTLLARRWPSKAIQEI